MPKKRLALLMATALASASLLVGMVDARAKFDIPLGAISYQLNPGSTVGGDTTPNNYGGIIYYWVNPTGGLFAGSNWGGETFAIGTINTLNGAGTPCAAALPGCYITGFTTVFEPAPAGPDTAIIGPLNSGPDSGGLFSFTTLYSYGNVTGPTYSVALGAASISQLIVQSQATPVSNPTNIISSPNLTLGGAFNVAYDADFSSDGVVPITITGSGTLAAGAFLNFAGKVNVTSGTLQGGTTVIDNSINDTGAPTLQSPVSSTTVTFSGGDVKLVTNSYGIVGNTTSGQVTLSLQNGALASFVNLYTGYNANASGNVIVDGATLATTGSVFIGFNGATTLMIQNSGRFPVTGTNSNVLFGVHTGSSANVTITGALSSLTNDGFIAIGGGGISAGDGGAANVTVTNNAILSSKDALVIGNSGAAAASLTISGGGVVTSNTLTVNPGDFAGIVGSSLYSGTANVTITGSGSQWNVRQSLSIGRGGAGTVTVSNGGTLEVDGSDLYLGRVKGGGSGTLVLDGASSTLMAPNTALHVGAGSTGEIDVRNNATLDQSGKMLVLGEQASGRGTIKVMSGGTLNVDNVVIGGAGTGELDLGSADSMGKTTIGTANITGAALVIGRDMGSTGTLNITGKSTLNFTGVFQDGLNGTGTISLQQGASLSTPSLVLGIAESGNGTLTVDTGSTFRTTNNLTVGGAGMGTLNVKGGGSLIVGGDLIAGARLGAGGTIDISGGASQKTQAMVTGNLLIGASADRSGDSDSATVENGAQLVVGKNISIGGNSTTGFLMITGPSPAGGQPSAVQYGGVLTVNPTGAVMVQNGGQLSSTGGSGGTDTIAGTLTLDGMGSTWKPSATVNVTGNGALNIQNGAKQTISTLSFNQNATGGPSPLGQPTPVSPASGKQTVNVMGVSPSDPTPPTALTISNAVTIPTGATVNVSNNATLTLNGSAESMIEGGTLNIMSAGRLTATSGNLNVGSQGQQGGMLMASGTTTVDLQSITIGDGSVVATVTSSAGEVTGGFTVHDFAFVGATGFGQLILQGGVFMVQGDLEVGSGGTGTIMASGQSTVRASSVAIGVSGKGTIQLSGGSQLSAPSIFLGEEPGSNGTLSIDGHTADDTEDPTLVVATSGVRVGQAGFGTLILTRGAVLMTPQISIAAEPGSEGTVSIDSASQISSLQAIFVGGSASGAGGTGTLDVSAGADLKVASEVFIYGGSTIKLGGGSIAISSAIQTPGTITIGTGGLLSGAGTIDTRSLSSARQLGVVMTTGFGIVHVGDDPGTLTIIGNYIQSPTGVLEVELGPNNNISTLAVTGTATLGGTLRIVPFNGGMLQLGHTYPVLTAAGGVIGNFATTKVARFV